MFMLPKFILVIFFYMLTSYVFVMKAFFVDLKTKKSQILKQNRIIIISLTMDQWLEESQSNCWE